jgi:hypothetical protein
MNDARWHQSWLSGHVAFYSQAAVDMILIAKNLLRLATDAADSMEPVT